jgi:hypothetical protein
MNKNIILFLVIAVFNIAVILNGCSNSGNNPTTNNTSDFRDKVASINNKNNDSSKAQDSTTQDDLSEDDKNKSNTYEIIDKDYNKNDVKINYPQIKNLSNQKKIEVINKSLEDEALSILNRYAKENSNMNNITMDIDYEVKLKSDKYLSIVYKGYSYVKGAAYPISVFYTTNIDMEKGSRIRLSDYVNINNILIKLKDPHNVRVLSTEREAAEAQKNILINMDNAELLSMLEDADFYEANGEIEMPEIGVYSYMNEDSIVISLPVNHAIGDHAEFELEM